MSEADHAPGQPMMAEPALSDPPASPKQAPPPLDAQPAPNPAVAEGGLTQQVADQPQPAPTSRRPVADTAPPSPVTQTVAQAAVPAVEALDPLAANPVLAIKPKAKRAPVRTVAKVRYLAPDVARGMALLGIALANLPTAWTDHPSSDYASSFGGITGQGSWLEHGLVVFQAMFVHVRGLPMFSTLLGVGMGMILVGLIGRGYTQRAARGVIARRYAWLLAFGLVHHVLVFSGDILAPYGFCALLIALLIGLSDRGLRVIGWTIFSLWAGFCTLGAVGHMVAPDNPKFNIKMGDVAGLVPDNYPDFVSGNLSSLWGVLMGPLMMLPMMLIGFIWGRSGLLQDIDQHARQLWTWVWIAVTVVVLVGLPWGLASIKVLPEHWQVSLTLLNTTWGPLTGPGILAAILLAMRPLQRQASAATQRGQRFTPPAWLVPFNELGKRSMTGYLLQSIIFFPLVMPFTLNLMANPTIPVQMLFATTVWLITLLICWALGRAGKPGPFEQLHRRLAYGKLGLADSYEPTAKELAVEEKRLAKIERRRQRKLQKQLRRGKAVESPAQLPVDMSSAASPQFGAASAPDMASTSPYQGQQVVVDQAAGLDSAGDPAPSMRDSREEYRSDPQPPSRTTIDGEHR